MAQQQTIETLRATAAASMSTGHGDLRDHPSSFRGAGQPPESSSAAEDASQDQDQDGVGGGAEADGSKTHPEDLADKMTRLVIGSAISPLQLDAPELPHSSATHQERSSTAASGEAQLLQNNVRALLVSHNSGWAEFARGFGLNPSHATPLPPPPLVSSTIIPKTQTINSVHGLVSLFPPKKEEALGLLDTYLSYVNLVHHVVDGPQTRFEIEFFYDLLLLDLPRPIEPSPMPVPPLLEPGWLSAMLAIFTLADKRDRGGLLRPTSPQALSDSQRADGKSKLWFEGCLQGLRMRLDGDEPLDLIALRSVCLVVWVFVLYGQDDEVLPAVNLNSRILYQACDKLQLHRDPSQVDPQLSPREAEDRRRIFYNLLNTDWLFSAISGKTYSPVGVDGHDVRLPRSIADRDPIPAAISGLAFRSLLMRQLRKLATLALLPGGISQNDAAGFEADLDRLDQRLPGWCEIDVDNFPSGQSLSDPQQQAEFSQKIITNVQLCAVRVRFHTKFAAPPPDAPPYMHQSASHHRAICISRAVRLLRLEQLHLQYSTRILGHSGYPRFHPIVGGLTLSALMAKSPDGAERRMLFDELSRFTAVIHSYGVLSQVTNLGILAIETALNEVRRGELAQVQALRIPLAAVPQNEDNSGEPYYPSPLIPETGYERHPEAKLNPSDRSSLSSMGQPGTIGPPNYLPAPLIIPSPGLASSPTSIHHQPGEVCILQPLPSRAFDGPRPERLDPLTGSSSRSPGTARPSVHGFGTFASAAPLSAGAQNPQTMGVPIDNLFAHLAGGNVGYEGLMVGWMGAHSPHFPAGGVAGQATTSSVGEPHGYHPPTVQNTWKQEW
ncbi:hypothetical protein PtA15_18A267 [Puccinia triticina]|nr:uncharacterized protein PtA15_18A267 [Puccinia triticina]WAQ93209.1 hypothetical protein PtA15_18A267 [Puccinia triticina]